MRIFFARTETDRARLALAKIAAVALGRWRSRAMSQVRLVVVLAADQAVVARADAEGGAPARARVVADYVAGMTDRFAFLELSRISKAF